MRIFLICLFLFLFSSQISCQNQTTCPSITPRQLALTLPTNQGVWVAPFNQSTDMIAVLVTNVESNNNSRFYVINSSSQCEASSQVHVQTNFNNKYQYSQLFVVDDLDGDYFSSILYERASGKEFIGMFKMYSHGPEALYAAGLRTRIGQDLELECRPCIIAGLMTAKKTWQIQQINFLTSKVFYNYTLPVQIDDIYLLNMEQDSAAGTGYGSYFLTLAAIQDSANTIQLMEVNMGNNSILFTGNYTPSNPIQSLNSYHGEVFSITTVDNKLEFIDMMLTNSFYSLIIIQRNGSILQKFSLGYPANLVVDCAIIYPNIACRNVRYIDSKLIPTGLLTFWTYQMPLPTEPIQYNPTCLGKYTVANETVNDLVAYPGQNKFIIATKDKVFIYAINSSEVITSI